MVSFNVVENSNYGVLAVGSKASLIGWIA